MPRRPAGRPQKVPRTELPRALPAPPGWPCPVVAESSPAAARTIVKIKFRAVLPCAGRCWRGTAHDFAPRNIAARFCVNLDRGITSWHPARAALPLTPSAHERETRSRAAGLPARSILRPAPNSPYRAAPRHRATLAAHSNPRSRAPPGLPPLLSGVVHPVATVLSEMPGQFRRLEQFRLKKRSSINTIASAMTAFLSFSGLKLSPHPNKIRPFRCTTHAATTQATWP